MPESRRRKKKGYVGRPTPPQRKRIDLGSMLRTAQMLDEAEEELLLKQLDEFENEENTDAPK